MAHDPQASIVLRKILGSIAVVLVLAGSLALAGWLRAYTFGAALGWRCWPIVPKVVEPVDCDEAVYAYIGHRLLQGDVLYRDLTETRPPAGYWLYTMAIALGGYNELTVRVLPMPFAMATVALVWLIAYRHYGAWAAALAAVLEAMLNNDPFVHGNGANFELYMNPLTLASLALVAGLRGDRGEGRLFAAGVCLGMAALFKQVVVTHLAVDFWFAWTTIETVDRPSLGRRRALALMAGAALPWLVASALIAAQGAFWDFLHVVFVYGPAMTSGATDAQGWERWVRFFRGNSSEPWWGRGSWPVWLVAAGSAAFLGLRSVGQASGPARRALAVDRLMVFWTLSCCVQVALPGLYWQHYYALAMPGVVLLCAAGLSRLATGTRWGRVSRPIAGAVGLALIASIGFLQYRAALARSPVDVATEAKLGDLWSFDRQIGQSIRRHLCRPGDRMFIWDYQSPIQFYSRCDSVTPYFFMDPLMVKYCQAPHPLIDPRKQRILEDLERERPELIFVGQPPFPGLFHLLAREYRSIWTKPTKDKPWYGFWLRSDRAEQLPPEQLRSSP